MLNNKMFGLYSTKVNNHIDSSQTEFDGSDGKESACSAGDPGLIPWLGRSLEKGMATPSSILSWRIP